MKTPLIVPAILVCIYFPNCLSADFPYFISEVDNNNSGVCLDVRSLSSAGYLVHSYIIDGTLPGELRTDLDRSRVSAFMAVATGSGGLAATFNRYLEQIAGTTAESSAAGNSFRLQTGQYTSYTQTIRIRFAEPKTFAEADAGLIAALAAAQADTLPGVQPVAATDYGTEHYILNLTVYQSNAGALVVGYVLLKAADDLVNGSLLPGGNAACNPDVVFAVYSPQVQQRQPADFLWVIDNSSSMSFYQTQTAEVAAEFASSIGGAGFDFRLGVITTDGSVPPELITTPADGAAFTADVAEFTERVLAAGTLGSTTESGIYTAEWALQSAAGGDAIDGTVTAAGFPRPGAALAVVVVSDEPDYYSSYTGFDFNPVDNLFTERSYTFNAIVNTSSAPVYSALAGATGGVVADIDGDFDEAVADIAGNYISNNTRYTLPEEPLPDSIRVVLDGEDVPEADGEGWVYSTADQTLHFSGSQIPQVTSELEVFYVVWL